MMPWICKEHGEIDVYRNVRAYGWCEEHFNSNGNQESIETDGLHFTQPKIYYCSVCGKQVKWKPPNKEEG